MRVAYRILCEHKLYKVSDRLILGCKGRGLVRFDLDCICGFILCISRRSSSLLHCVLSFHQVDRIALSIGFESQLSGSLSIAVIDCIYSSLDGIQAIAVCDGCAATDLLHFQMSRFLHITDDHVLYS